MSDNILELLEDPIDTADKHRAAQQMACNFTSPAREGELLAETLTR